MIHLQVKKTLATSSSLTMEPDGTFVEAEECKTSYPASEKLRLHALELMNKIMRWWCFLVCVSRRGCNSVASQTGLSRSKFARVCSSQLSGEINPKLEQNLFLVIEALIVFLQRLFPSAPIQGRHGFREGCACESTDLYALQPRCWSRRAGSGILFAPGRLDPHPFGGTCEVTATQAEATAISTSMAHNGSLTFIGEAAASEHGELG